MAAAGTTSPAEASSTALQKRTKKMTYTSYEANAWKATFEQSGGFSGLFTHPESSLASFASVRYALVLCVMMHFI